MLSESDRPPQQAQHRRVPGTPAQIQAVLARASFRHELERLGAYDMKTAGDRLM